ncbi:MAG TPA: TIGR02206 family membrane protein [Acidobacteriota bacterium]|jgi:hypothetical integral membrane protein (TIGR02206 family)|nr:TIGR02206 family membrane protein [Acidobacteriota bacterium]
MDIPRFELFDITHVTALAVLTAATLAFLREAVHWSRNARRSAEHWVAFIALANGVVWRVVLYRQNDFRLDTDLPLHLCSISTFLLGLAVLLRSQALYDIAFYWIATGSTLAMIFPDLEAPFPRFRFFALFLSHWIPILGTLYLTVVENRRPSPRAYIRASAALLIYGFFVVLPMNRYLGTNYLFTEAHPDIAFEPASWLPEAPYHVPVLAIFFVLLFYAVHRFLVSHPAGPPGYVGLDVSGGNTGARS